MIRKSIATVVSACQSADELAQLSGKLNVQLECSPKLIIASYTSLCDTQMLANNLASLYPGTSIIGASTCRGAMTTEGLVAFGEANVALWGLCDEDGDYGVGFAPLVSTAREATDEAVERAFEQSGRNGELPGLIWMHTSPGIEEEVVATLDSIFDGDVSIVGGTAADETLEGNWSCFAGREFAGSGVAITLFFSSFNISTSFQSGYIPTTKTGVATRCEGRTVFEIDNQPAAEVYNQWSDQKIDFANETFPINVMQASTLTPLGMAVGEVSGISYYSLVLPDTFTEDRALTFLGEVAEGETLTLMSGTVDNIISRPGRVANEAIHNDDVDQEDVLGGLVVFCGGCLLAVEPRVAEIAEKLNESMQGSPFLGCFTLGEQGRLLGGENRHGNLMTSVTVFSR